MTHLGPHLETDPTRRRGAVKLRGSRLTVSDLALLHLRLGRSVDQIAGDYALPLASIYAALAHYYDHRQEIDERIAADEAYADDLQRSLESPLGAKLGAIRAAI